MAQIVLKKNSDILCGFYEDNQNSSNEDGTGSCSATVVLNEGKDHSHSGLVLATINKISSHFLCTKKTRGIRK